VTETQEHLKLVCTYATFLELFGAYRRMD